MGTLFSQAARWEGLGAAGIEGVAVEMFPKAGELTPEQWHAACDVARTSLTVQSADAFDEQFAGFGEIAIRLVEALEESNLLKERED